MTKVLICAKGLFYLIFTEIKLLGETQVIRPKLIEKENQTMNHWSDTNDYKRHMVLSKKTYF